MRIAFYAPLKSPDHPVPSGDREVGRALMALLRLQGHVIDLASRLRSFDGAGDARRQLRLQRVGRWQAARYVRAVRAETLPRPDLWFTYHGYHKAPDHLGPAVADALRIPLVMAEASIAGKQAGGTWALGHAVTLAAMRQASGLLAMTDRDCRGLRAVSGRQVDATLLRPFLDTAPFARARRNGAAQRVLWAKRAGLPPGKVWLLAVAMMRDDVKRRSFEFLARSLGELAADPSWHLIVAGEGAARAAIEQTFKRQVGDRATFLGAVPRADLPSLDAAADLFVWPAFNEAYGMALLEAQAAGLPVVAGDHGGVGEIVAQGETGILVAGAEERHFAAAIRALLTDDGKRRAMGMAAVGRVERLHGLDGAASVMAEVLAEAGKRHRAALEAS